MTSSVLIADSNRARARRIAEACTARGLSTTQADTGAIALEMALADVPQLILAGADLALIDARRLAEILRANPRTQDVRYLLLGRESAQRPTGLFDELLPPDAPEGEIAARLEAMLAQRARVNAVERETAADHEVQGKLSQIPLTDLLQVFHMNRRSGVVVLTRMEAGGRQARGEIWLREGNVVQSRAGAKVEGEKALFRLLGWRDGSFAFTPNRVNTPPRILTPTRALLLEGMRQLDEWDRLRGTLPPLAARVVLSVKKEDLPNAVHPVTQELLLLLEIYDGVRDLVDHCSYPDYQVLRTLQTLVERGIVELRRAPDRLGDASPALFDATQLRRFRDWLETGRPRSSPALTAKLLIASPDRAVTSDFVNLLSALPAMQLSPAFQRGGVDPNDVVAVGKLELGEGLALELIQVPLARELAPAWPVLARGALGILLLLSEPIGDSERRLNPLLESLRSLPNSRLFHVLLLRKGERVSAEQIREKLPLLDTSSLFLLQVEGGKDPASLLRTMLGRVLP